MVAAELGVPAWPKVIIVDETMREGMQIESADIPLEAKVELLDALARTGLGHIVVGSFVSPKWTPQMANVDALLDQFQPAEGVRYTALALNPKGRERMERYMPPLAEPLGLPRTLVHLCDVFVRRNTNRSQQDEIADWAGVIGRAADEGAESAGIAINAAWGSNWVGPFDDAYRLRMLQAQHDAWTAAGIPVDRVWIGDPMAWNMPHHVTGTLRSIKQRWPAITTFHLHLHNARGSAPISAYAALTTLDAGDTLILDTAVGGMGGCPYCGHGRLTQMIPTEDLVDLLEELGIPTGVDLAELLKVARLAERVVGHELWGHVSKAGPRPHGEGLFAMDMPFIETPEQAQHFWRGPSAYIGAISPWSAPIVSPMRTAAETRAGQSNAGAPPGNGSPAQAPEAPEVPEVPEVPASLIGIRVVDLTSNVAGPFATQVLGDLGADVVKVERPGGDDARGWGPPFWPSTGQGVAFSSLNTNKRSIELDLRSESGAHVFRALLERADVLVQNMRPGTFEGLGYSWDMLHGLNPRLVYCELNGFGASGPKADQPAYDVFMQAFSGLMSFTGEAGRPPVRIPVSVLDKGTGLWSVIGILNALRLRDQTGLGSHVQASLLETALKWEAGQILGFAAGGQDPKPWGSSTPGMAPYEAFKTCRGYIIIAAGNERLWRKLCTVLGRPDLASDARFATNAERWQNSAQLSAEITAVLATRDALEWAELLRDAGIPGGVINSVSQALDDEQVQALGLLAGAAELPEAKYAFVHTPLLTGGQRFPIRSLAPELNAHAAELLAELGLDDLEPTSADAHPARSGEGKDD